VTHEDIVYDRRVRLIEHAARIGNVSEACRVFGVSRKTYYEWIKRAEQYGLSALLPRERRRPHQPNEMTSEEVAVILSEAIARPTLGPTLGPKSLLRHLKKRGVERSASGVAKVLRRHSLGTAKQRVIALASLTATETGQLTEAALEGPFGFCQYASHPGQVVALDAFYVGKLKGVGAVWQLTAVDIATRIAVVQLVVGDKTATVAALLLDHLKKALRWCGQAAELPLSKHSRNPVRLASASSQPCRSTHRAC
jgi:transposase